MHYIARLVAILLLTAMACLEQAHAQAQAAQWVAAWGRPFTGDGSTRSNATVRNVARLTIGGDAVRIRLTNTSASPMTIGAAYVARQLGPTGPALVAGSTRQITFNGGQPGVTIPPRTDFIYSDPVPYPVQAQQHLAVSLYLPGAAPAAGTSQWSFSYASPNGTGNLGADESGALISIPVANSTYALTGIDVLTVEADGAVVALGSSTFQGFDSTPEGYDDFLVQLSARINAELPVGMRKGLVSAGIGGDTLRASLDSRLPRDVFSHTGVKGVIVYNVNDLGQGRSALQIAQDYMFLIGVARPLGVKVFCPTWPPAAQSLTSAAERAKLNGWLLNSGNCDGTVDWDAVVRWEAGPNRNVYHPNYQGDSIHMNRFGHQAIANSTPLGWFVDKWPFGPQPGTPPVLVPELVVASDDIATSGEKESARIHVTVRNVGDADAANIVVRVFVNDQLLGDSVIGAIPIDGSGTATVAWNLRNASGTFVIRAVVDPNGAIEEGRKDNNEASRSVSVQGGRPL